MDYQILFELIGSVAFPIVAFVMMFWMCNETLKEVNSSVQENTRVIAELTARLEEGTHKLDGA